MDRRHSIKTTKLQHKKVTKKKIRSLDNSIVMLNFFAATKEVPLTGTSGIHGLNTLCKTLLLNKIFVVDTISLKMKA